RGEGRERRRGVPRCRGGGGGRVVAACRSQCRSGAPGRIGDRAGAGSGVRSGGGVCGAEFGAARRPGGLRGAGAPIPRGGGRGLRRATRGGSRPVSRQNVLASITNL